jgi:hypothetical protein
MSEQPSARAAGVRLIFEYEGDTVRLVSQVPVDVDVASFSAAEASSAHFVETRNDQGAVLTRVPVHGAFVQSAEVFPEDHTQEITRVETESRGAFTVLVPAQDGAVRVAVMRVATPRLDVPPGGGQSPSPTPDAAQDVELGTFPLERRR